MNLGPGTDSMEWFLVSYLATLAFCWGACWGSFLNVCIYRIPRDLSVVRPRSHCPGCGTPIAWYDNIPLVSFLALRARCRRCGGRISPRYVLVELLTAVLFLLLWLKLGAPPRPLGLAPVADPWLVLVYWLAAAGLVLGTFVDLEHMIIPDRVTLGGIGAGLVLSALVPSLHHPGGIPGALPFYRGLLDSLLGAAVGFFLLWGVAALGRVIFRREAMGFGDVKLLGAIGAFLGWKAVLFSLLVSSFLGALVGISLVIAGGRSMKSKIPYGPYLALAALLWILWGPTLCRLYTAFLFPC